MANPLFESLYGGKQNAQVQHSASMQDALNRLRSNPVMAVRQAGFNIPDEIGNDPKSISTYLIQSGQVSNPVLQRIRPLLNQLTGF